MLVKVGGVITEGGGYFRVCVSVAVFLSAETSLYHLTFLQGGLKNKNKNLWFMCRDGAGVASAYLINDVADCER